MAKLQVGVNDLETWCNNNGAYGVRLKREWVGEDESGNAIDMWGIPYGSGKRVKWRCDYGHEWLREPKARTKHELGSSNCPVCSSVFSPYEVWLFLALRQIYLQAEYRKKFFASDSCPQGFEYDISIQLDDKLILIEVSTTFRHACKLELDAVKASTAYVNGAEFICIELMSTPDTLSRTEIIDKNLISVFFDVHKPVEPLRRVLALLLERLDHTIQDVDFNTLSEDFHAAYSLGSMFIYTLEDWCSDNPDRGNHLIKEWVGELGNGEPITMRSILAGSSRYVKWRCSICGREWATELRSRTYKGRDCTSCCQRYKGTTLAEWCVNNPERGELLQSQWTGIRKDIPSHVYNMTDIGQGSGFVFLWRCNNNHFWFAQLAKRTGLISTDCPVCSHHYGNIISIDKARELYRDHGLPFPETSTSGEIKLLDADTFTKVTSSYAEDITPDK